MHFRSRRGLKNVEHPIYFALTSQSWIYSHTLQPVRIQWKMILNIPSCLSPHLVSLQFTICTKQNGERKRVPKKRVKTF